MKISLIRHGLTPANEKRLYCGKTDVSLSENGIEGIKRLKAAGVYPPADFVITSGMKRADETANLIYGKIDRRMPCFSEFSFGEFEMKSYEELKGDERYIRWILDKTGDIFCPGGDCRNEFLNRATCGFKELTAENWGGKTLAIITHGGVVAAIMEHLFGSDFFGMTPGHGCGYLITNNLEQYKKIEG